MAVIVTFAAPVCAGTAAGTEGSRIAVSGDNNYPPYEFLDSAGEPTGFNVDLIRAVADAMGMEVEIRLGPWADVRKALETGKVDMLQGMFYSEKRALTVEFSIPHTTVYHTIFVRKGSGRIRSLEDLKDKSVLVQKGDIMHDYVQESRLSRKIIPVAAPEDALRLLASGKHDCALLAKTQGLYLINRFKLSNLTTAGNPFSPRQYCFAVRKGNEPLVARLNEGLGIIKATGRYKEIHDKWMGVLEPPGVSRTAIIRYALLALIIFLLLAAFAVFWFWSLKRQVALRTRELKKEITERERTGKALKESEEKYRSIFENAVEGIFQSTPEGRYLSVNPALARMYGYESPEEMMGAVTDIEAQQYVQSEERARLKDIYEARGFVEGFETRIYRKDGTPIWVSMNARVVRKQDGGILCYEGTALDISERKQAEARLKTSLAEKEVLLKEIHHRVKNNLQVMSSLLNLQSQHLSDTNARDMFKMSMDRIRSMALIHDKLYRSEDLSRIYFPGYVRELARGLMSTYSLGRPIALDVNIDPCSFDIDTAIPLALVLNELVTNSLKHGFPGERDGMVAIGLAVSDNSMTLTVSDDGIGFPSDLDFRNTGSLGMQLVITLVEQIEGTIELKEGPGTAFRIIFGSKDEAEESPA